MKKYICILGVASLLAACEQKSETVTPPAGEKKETNTTVVNPSPATSKTETNTTINTSSSPAASATP
jgi:PBP1b-binding outer membrane lipoprotein LpoB